MTRNRRYDYELLKREYIHSSTTPPISYTELAEKYGMPRSLLTDRGAKENWTAERKEFRAILGVKTTEAMADKIIEFQIATRERGMTIMLAALDQYAKDLAAGEVKITTRDMLGIVSGLRDLIGEQINAQPREEGLLDPDAINLHPDEIRRLLAGISEDAEDDGADADDAPPEPPAAARPN